MSANLWYSGSETLTTPLTQLTKLWQNIHILSEAQSSFFYSYICITVPATITVIVSLLSIFNRLIPDGIKNLLLGVRWLIFGAFLEAVGVLLAIDTLLRFEHLSLSHDRIIVYMNLYVILQLLGVTVFCISGLTSFGILKNKRLAFGIILDMAGALLTTYTACMYATYGSPGSKKASLFSCLGLGALTIEGAGMLIEVSVFKEIGNFITPVFSFIYKGVLAPVCRFIYYVIGWIMENVIGRFITGIWDYIIKPIANFIRNPPPPPPFVVAFFIFVRDKIIIAPCIAIYNLIVAICQFIINRVYDILYFISSVLGFVRDKIIYPVCGLIYSMASAVKNTSMIASTFIVNRVILPLCDSVIYAVSTAVNFVRDKIIYPVCGLIYDLVGVVCDHILLPLMKWICKWIIELILNFLWKYSLSILLFIFTVGFFKSAYRQLNHHFDFLSLDFFGFLLGGYVNFVVFLILAAPLVRNASFQMKVVIWTNYLYRQLGFGIPEVVFYLMKQAFRHSSSIIRAFWRVFFGLISVLLQGIVRFVWRFFELVHKSVFVPVFKFLKRGISSIWNNPYLSLLASILVLYGLYQLHGKFYLLVPIANLDFSYYFKLIWNGIKSLEVLIPVIKDLGSNSWSVLVESKAFLAQNTNSWVGTSLQNSFFTLSESSSFGWMVYLTHVLFVQLVRVNPNGSDCRFLSRSCMKMIYFPLLFFGMFNSDSFYNMMWNSWFVLGTVFFVFNCILIRFSVELLLSSALMVLLCLCKLVFLKYVAWIVASFGAVIFILFYIGMSAMIFTEAVRRANAPIPPRPEPDRSPAGCSLPPKMSDKKLISKLKALEAEGEASHKFESPECTMCLEPFEGESMPDKTTSAFLYLPHCGHKFHVDCISSWIEAHNTCPICREYVFGRSNIRNVFL